jgi:alpha-tubulin suppressor-like RCC1 family protein
MMMMPVQAAIGGWHCLALSDEGQVYCWGGERLGGSLHISACCLVACAVPVFMCVMKARPTAGEVRRRWLDKGLHTTGLHTT